MVEISENQVSIKTLTIGEEQLSLSIFVQIPVKEMHTPEGDMIEGFHPWGIVRYPVDSAQEWVVGTHNGNLFRCAFPERIEIEEALNGLRRALDLQKQWTEHKSRVLSPECEYKHVEIEDNRWLLFRAHPSEYSIPLEEIENILNIREGCAREDLEDQKTRMDGINRLRRKLEKLPQLYIAV